MNFAIPQVFRNQSGWNIVCAALLAVIGLWTMLVTASPPLDNFASQSLGPAMLDLVFVIVFGCYATLNYHKGNLGWFVASLMIAFIDFQFFCIRSVEMLTR